MQGRAGVDESDFCAVRAPSEIRKTFEAIGYRMSDAEFAAIHARVS